MDKATTDVKVEEVVDNVEPATDAKATEKKVTTKTTKASADKKAEEKKAAPKKTEDKPKAEEKKTEEPEVEEPKVEEQPKTEEPAEQEPKVEEEKKAEEPEVTELLAEEKPEPVVSKVTTEYPYSVTLRCPIRTFRGPSLELLGKSFGGKLTVLNKVGDFYKVQFVRSELGLCTSYVLCKEVERCSY